VNFPTTHPIWMWLYFGIFGTLGILLFILIMWNWMKYHAAVEGNLRSSARWMATGYMFLFFAEWFACGIGGPPGNMLSSDLATHSSFGALGAASLSMFFSVPGWACLFVGQRKLFNDVQSRPYS
jgi:hypothetical protein